MYAGSLQGWVLGIPVRERVLQHRCAHLASASAGQGDLPMSVTASGCSRIQETYFLKKWILGTPHVRRSSTTSGWIEMGVLDGPLPERILGFCMRVQQLRCAHFFSAEF